MATFGDSDSSGVREALEAAFAQHSADDSGADAPAPAPTPAAPAPGPAEAPAEAPGEAPAPAPAEGRVRDASGRFTQAPAAAPAAAAPAAGTPAPPPLELKPPASWTPTAREKWAGLDPEVRSEVHRREVEAQRVLQQSAQHRQFADAFESVVRPYEVFIRQENSNPLQAVQNLMQTAAEFRVGTPARKVELVAGIIKNFGIDVEALDTFLAGNPPQGGYQQQAFRDPRVDQLLYAQQAERQQAQLREQQQVHATMKAFAESHEFYRDVESTMADILEMRAKRGEVIDLEKAYEQACKMTEGVANLLAQRKTAAPAQQNSAAVLRAKRAASSIKADGTPAGGAVIPKDDSVRASIEAAIESLSDS